MHRSFILVFLICAKFAFADNKPSDVLEAQDYQRIMRAIIFVEKSVRKHRDAKDLPASSNTGEPLHPKEACSYCGSAMRSAAYFLLLQGVKPKQIQLFNLRLKGGFDENSFPHVVAVYHTMSREHSPITVVLDPTFSQIEVYSYKYTSRGAEYTRGIPPGDHLMASAVGRDLIHNLRREGFWIADDLTLKIWGEAMTAHPETGEMRPHHVLTLSSLQEGNLLLNVTDEALAFTQLSKEQIESELQGISSEEILQRVKSGNVLDPLSTSCGRFSNQIGQRDRS